MQLAAASNGRRLWVGQAGAGAGSGKQPVWAGRAWQPLHRAAHGSGSHAVVAMQPTSKHHCLRPEPQQPGRAAAPFVGVAPLASHRGRLVIDDMECRAPPTAGLCGSMGVPARNNSLPLPCINSLSHTGGGHMDPIRPGVHQTCVLHT